MLLRTVSEGQPAEPHEVVSEVRPIAGHLTHLIHAGSGRASLVWFPAVGDGVSTFALTLAALARRFSGRLRVLAADPPGYGASPGLPGAQHLPTFAEIYPWAAEVLEAAAVSGGPVISAGNSSGAAIAAGGAARTSAQVAGLICACWADWRGGPRPTADDLCPNDMASLLRLLARSWHQLPRVPESMSRRMLEMLRSPAYHRHIESFDAAASSADIARFQGPLAYVGGLADRLVPPASIEDAARARPGTEVRWIEDCGHYPHRERPARFVAVLGEIVERFLAPPAGARAVNLPEIRSHQ